MSGREQDQEHDDETVHDGDEIEQELADAAAAGPPRRRAMIEWPGGARS